MNICDLHNNLQTNLKILRILEGHTQEQVSEILMISRSSYSRLESGKALPDLDTLCRISDYYGISIDQLIGHNLNDL